jgi:hypothetical protein
MSDVGVLFHSFADFMLGRVYCFSQKVPCWISRNAVLWNRNSATAKCQKYPISRYQRVRHICPFAYRLCLQIAESFRRFGISDTTTSLLVIKVSVSPSITHESVAQHLGLVVKGTLVEFSNKVLDEMTDLARVRKIYKLNTGQNAPPGRGDAGGSGMKDAGPSERKELEIAVIGAMALRGAS